jgi:hypothetical protein
MRFHIYFILTLNVIFITITNGQPSHFKSSYSTELGGIVSTSKQIPFWLRANQYGIVPLSSPIGTLRVGTIGELKPDSSKNRKWSIQYSAEIVSNVGHENQLILPVLFGQINLGKFYLYAGRKKEVIGLGDSTLSSGFYSWSQNALPLHKVQIGTKGFVPIGFTKGLLSINLIYAHGWFSNTDSISHSFLHQKAIYGRIGKPNWKLKLYGGILHNVQWGGQSNYVKDVDAVSGQLPSSFKDYLYSVIAKTPQGQNGKYSYVDSLNQIGNHLGSVDIGIEYILKDKNVLLYYQHAFDDKSGLAMKNLPDGLFGLRIKNFRGINKSSFTIRQLTIEYLTTMSQSGSIVDDPNSKYAGQDNYFNNLQYLNGWSNKERIQGTPFITRGKDTRYNNPIWAVNNNRVKMIHAAVYGNFKSGISIEAKFSFSKNYGLYVIPFYAEQFSSILTLVAPIHKNLNLTTSIATDSGGLYNNSTGMYIGLKRVW